jgi:heptosyltransferase-2
MNKFITAKRILVVRHRFIGDTILAVPFLKNLRHAYPDAQIDILVGPESGQVLKYCPYINNTIIFDTTNFHKYDRGHNKKRNLFSYAKELKKNNYDLVLLLKRSWSSAFLAFLTRAKYRVGYDTEFRRIFLTHAIKWDKHKHEIESTFDVLRAIDVPIIDNRTEYWLSDEEIKAIDNKVPSLNLKGDNKISVLFHAAAAHPDKMYPIKSWAEIIKKLSNIHNINAYFIGAEQDKALYQELMDTANIQGFNLAGKLSLRESMALLKKIDLAICVDSGPAHLANAAGCPTITLFGPTDPVRWQPLGVNNIAIFDKSLICRPCNYNKTCRNRECLTELNPEIIIDACKKILTNNLICR